MGQYFKVVNLDKKQFFSPKIFNDGVKLSTVMNGIHPFVIGKLLLACSDSNIISDKFRTGYWSRDRIVIVGDETKNCFSEFQSSLNLKDYETLDDLIISEFENIGAELLFSFINNNDFQKLILKALENDSSYYAKVAYLTYKYPNKSDSLKHFLIQNFGKDWDKKARVIWEDKKTTFIELNV